MTKDNTQQITEEHEHHWRYKKSEERRYDQNGLIYVFDLYYCTKCLEQKEKQVEII